MSTLGIFSSYPAVAQTEFNWRQPTHSFKRNVQTERVGGTWQRRKVEVVDSFNILHHSWQSHASECLRSFEGTTDPMNLFAVHLPQVQNPNTCTITAHSMYAQSRIYDGYCHLFSSSDVCFASSSFRCSSVVFMTFTFKNNTSAAITANITNCCGSNKWMIVTISSCLPIMAMNKDCLYRTS